MTRLEQKAFLLVIFIGRATYVSRRNTAGQIALPTSAATGADASRRILQHRPLRAQRLHWQEACSEDDFMQVRIDLPVVTVPEMV